MKIFSYIFKHKLLLLLLIVLISASTFLNYLLPFVQRGIINIGLAQNGIEHVAPDAITKNYYDSVVYIANTKSNIITNSYNLNDTDTYILNDVEKSNIDALDEAITQPLAYIDQCFENNETLTFDGFNSFIKDKESGIIKQMAFNASKKQMEFCGVDIFSKQLNYILSQSSIMLILTVLICIVAYALYMTNTRISLLISYEKRKELFESITKFTNREINQFGESSLITRATSDIQILQNFTSSVLSTLINAPINIIIGLIFAYITAPMLTWLIIAAALAILIASIISVKILSPIFMNIQKLHDKINLVTREILTGIFTIRAFNNVTHEEDRFKRANKPLFKTQLFTGRLMGIINPLLILGTNLVAIIIILIGGYNINLGNLQVGDIIAFSSYAVLVIWSFSNLGIFIGTLPRATVAVKRIESVINTKASVLENNNAQKFNNNFDKSGKITFKDVCYSYNNNNIYELKNINFEIKAGETLGIIGEVGSGKTTIINLLLRLCDTSKGQILLNNKDIKELNVNSYTKLFAYSPQNSFLFSGDIKSNIEYGLDNKISQLNNTSEILEQVQLYNFVESLPHKIQQNISQDSINISGGQKQRISIARSLASQRPILVFDDCFSSLDYKIEEKILTSINNEYKNYTKIFVTSRLSTIANADKILCLYDGQIVGQGAYGELKKTCPEFLKIVKSQTSTLNNTKERHNN